MRYIWGSLDGSQLQSVHVLHCFRSVRSSVPKLLGRVTRQMLKSPKPHHWSWRDDHDFWLYHCFILKDPNMQRRGLFCTYGKAFFKKVGQLSKLKSQGELANTIVTRHSYKEKYQESLRPKRPLPVEASCKKNPVSLQIQGPMAFWQWRRFSKNATKLQHN